ncbi:hypothetical protein SLT67_12605 [Paenibacillus illinoisensis]|uniref:hypothetical protein n=1 Tax=Paenibacillus TaxID=44249 RepID=UPI0034590D14
MKNAKVAYLLFFFNAVYLITLLGYPVVLMLCVFMFDAPTSHDYVSNYITVYIMASYPVAVLLSLSCWFFYHVRKFKWALVIGNLLLFWVAAIILVGIASSFVSF